MLVSWSRPVKIDSYGTVHDQLNVSLGMNKINHCICFDHYSILERSLWEWSRRLFTNENILKYMKVNPVYMQSPYTYQTYHVLGLIPRLPTTLHHALVVAMSLR